MDQDIPDFTRAESGFFVEANLVPDDRRFGGNSEVVEAVAVAPRNKKIRMGVLIAIAGVILAVAVTVGVIVAGVHQKESSTINFSSSGGTTAFSELEHRLDTFFQRSINVLSVLQGFEQSGLFPNGLDARDRDAFLAISFPLREEYLFDALYYGSEEGMFMGYKQESWGTYREPVNSYRTDDPAMQKYYQACVEGENGDPANCTLSMGSQYIGCTDNYSLSICPDEESQESCTDNDIESCTTKQKWCSNYEIKKVSEDEARWLGFVPRTYYCHNSQGQFSQAVGEILKPDGQLGNCVYGNGITLVNRTGPLGDYSYCQGSWCDDLFVGGFKSRNYDPRFRPWYRSTRALQKPNWTPPYIFFSSGELGMSYSVPKYEEDKLGRKVFTGVYMVTYLLNDITDFLVEDVGLGSDQHLAIYEAKEPNYFVASSTGRPSIQSMLESDHGIGCPENAGLNGLACSKQRVPMKNLHGHPFDDIFREAYLEQERQGYPEGIIEVPITKASETAICHSIWSRYKPPSQGFEWILLSIQK